MIQAGVRAAFGPRLRLWLAGSTRNRVVAFGAGLLATLALQSSTATAMMISSFVSREFVTPAMAQAVMLGANVGTSLVARALALDVRWLSAVFVLGGVVIHKARDDSRWRSLAGALIGLGLMLLALDLLGAATVPIQSSATVQAVLIALADAPALAALFAATLAAVGSSSLAVVLLVMSLAATNAFDPSLVLVLVAGANLGGAVPPFLATAKDGVGARRVTLTNLGVRLFGTVLVVLLADQLAPLATTFHPGGAALAVDAHIGFNLALALLFLPLVGWLAALARRLIPAPKRPKAGPRFLNVSSLQAPTMALTSAGRETLRIGDIIHEMLSNSREALRTNDVDLCAELSKKDDQVDELHEAVKVYLSHLDRETLSPADTRRSGEVISYAINLEHIGDIVDKGILEVAKKKAVRGLRFSDEGQAEIEALYERTLENLIMAQTVFMSRDISLARRLVESKVDIRKMERGSAERHLERVRSGRLASVQTSTLHLDILRDLKRINAHVVSVAYPILDELGALRESRLADADSADAQVLHGASLP